MTIFQKRRARMRSHAMQWRECCRLDHREEAAEALHLAILYRELSKGNIDL